jgi:hypothetical protein
MLIILGCKNLHKGFLAGTASNAARWLLNVFFLNVD